MDKLRFFVLILALPITCCQKADPPQHLFTLLDPKDTKVIFSNDLTDTEDFNIVEYLNYYNGAGIAAGDINNDGLVDLYFASNQNDNKLFLNLGNFKFKDISAKAEVACPGGWKTGVSMADINGDGLLDIYVCQVGDYKTVQGENYLYINNGDMTFTDRTEEYGLKFKGFSTQSVFFDYDNDGDLDMFLLNHAIHTPGSYGRAAIIRYSRDLKTGDRLFEQIEKEGKPYFVNVTERAGILSSRIGYGLGVAAGDVNNDGCIDLYISNDFHENDYLYINNCDGTFTEKIRISMGHTTKSSMGNDMADFNNDGLLDIFSLDMIPEDETILKRSAGEEMMEVYDLKEQLGYYYQLSRNALQLNRGAGVFSEIAAFSGVYATDWSWVPLFFDADNNGLKDLFITNGIPRRPNDLDYLQFLEDNAERINTTGQERISNLALIDQMPSDTIANYAYKNNGDLTFTNFAETWGLNQKSFSNGCVYVDLDNDGDLDLVVNNLNENCFIYRNNAETLTAHNFLKIKLAGSEKNRFGIGARVEIWNQGEVQVQQMMPSRGSMSSVDPTLNFGVGMYEFVDSIRVQWPGHKNEVRKNLRTNQTIVFDIANATLGKKSKIEAKPLFRNFTDSIGVKFRHRESSFSDFVYQPLLPHSLSTQGPKIAIRDVNGDGMDDIYICGGGGQPGQLFAQKNNGDFEYMEQKAFLYNAGGEETDAIFFDADMDGDFDLFVARGSTELFIKPELNTDLLYLNDGKGNFTLDNSIPALNSISSCVSVGDFDHDGAPDIFIGSRPGLTEYGMPGTNVILHNNGNGRFTDKTDILGSELKSIGMVTDAVWADVDGDSVNELVVVGEWMGIHVFKFIDGKFLDISSITGLENTGGWWNAIAAEDIDNDGDIDFIVGNLGLNAKIKATTEKPATLYAKDFDGNGIVDPIISYFKNGQSIPFPTRDDLIAQIPSLKNKFPTYEAYSRVRSISDIFSDDQLSGANKWYAHEFRTSIMENLGNGKFRFIPLPLEVQLFPVYAILVKDIDGDGIKDIILGGNLHKAHITFGRYDAGYGLFLKGKGSLQYDPQPISNSGLLLRGETRDIKSVKVGESELLFVTKQNADWQIVQIID
jgi:enediyne biosynthesis protein E4